MGCKFAQQLAIDTRMNCQSVDIPTFVCLYNVGLVCELKGRNPDLVCCRVCLACGMVRLNYAPIAEHLYVLLGGNSTYSNRLSRKRWMGS